MNRAELQRLAEDRILDAQALLAAGRWSAAYYLAGYAVECGLKACVMGLIEQTGIIFQDKKFAERCWTHNIEELVKLADLDAPRGIDTAANPARSRNWTVVKDWMEKSRYEQRTELEARKLFNAINDPVNGVLQWIKGHW